MKLKTRMGSTVLILLAAVGFWASSAASVSAAPPVLFFSDLDSGPKTGWENGSSRGCAVSIWGLNFGAQSTGSKVTVGGQDILSTDATFIAEWDVAGIARGLRRITFWLKPASADGATQITVTTAEGTSNPLPFTVRPGNIYYCTPSGSDSNSGRTTSAAWLNPYKGLSMAPGDILYLRAGTYTGSNNTSRAHIWMDNEHGTAGYPMAWVSYPGEVATIGDGTLNGFSQYNYTGHGDNHDITIAKIKFDVRSVAVGSGQSGTPWYNFRVIANDIQHATVSSWAGAIYFAYFWNVKILGNYINNCGFDKYDHSIYINSYPAEDPGHDSYNLEIAWNEITNQNNGSNIKIAPKASGSIALVDDVYIHSNYIHDSPNEAITVGQRAEDVTIFNNLIVRTGIGSSYNGGIKIGFNSTSSARVRVFNNTFINTGKNSSFVGIDSDASVIDIKNNIFFDDVQNNFWESWSFGGTINGESNSYHNFAPPSWETVAVSGYPLLDQSGFLWMPSESSPCVDSGVDTSVMVNRDFLGRPRPQNGMMDLGAIEFYTGSEPGEPPPDEPPPPPPEPLPPPSSVSAVPGDSIDVTWASVAGAAGYNVYRSETQGTGYQKLNTVSLTATSYVDLTVVGGRMYYYVVTSISPEGLESVYSVETGCVAPSDLDSASVILGQTPDADFPGTVEDTFINVNHDINSGSPVLKTYTWPVNTVANAVLMKWDLSTIPSGAVVENATLWLYMTGTEEDGGDSGYDVSVHKLLHFDPQMDGADGYTYDGVHSWTPNSLCYAGIPMAQADIGPAEDIETIDNTLGYRTWNVTSMVQDWIGNPGANFGMLLNADTSAASTSNRIFASSENAVASQRPKLVISYGALDGEAPPPVNEAPVITSFTATPASLDNPGGQVAFLAQASDPDGDALSCSMNFGDGTTGSGSQLIHTYGNAGTYSATVTVDDAHGHSASRTVTVTVYDLPPATPANIGVQ